MIPQQPSASIAVHGLVEGEPASVRIDRLSIVFTIESATARAGALTLDRSVCLVTARDVLALESIGSASRVGVIGLYEPVLAEAQRTYAGLGFDRRKLDRWTRKRSLLPRTVWVHELLHRYLFERTLGEHANLTTRFLEVELAKEVYFLFRDRDSGAERASILRSYSAPVERALRHIDAHLLDECSVAALARLAGTSASTLLRLFRTEVGCSPGAYWRNRKLDEALVALRAGKTVGEVAARVGYENPTAFGFAFRRRFGRPPSTFRPAGRVRPTP